MTSNHSLAPWRSFLSGKVPHEVLPIRRDRLVQAPRSWLGLSATYLRR